MGALPEPWRGRGWVSALSALLWTDRQVYLTQSPQPPLLWGSGTLTHFLWQEAPGRHGEADAEAQTRAGEGGGAVSS